jgi:CNT family concentrative nucleoside transporter
LFGFPQLSFQACSATSSPRSCSCSHPWEEAKVAGGLFGTKIVLNEFVAFIDLGALDPGAISARTRAIVTFALCGFATSARSRSRWR